MAEPPKSWLETIMESDAFKKRIEKVKESFGPDFAPDLIFNFDHVMAAIGIVEAAITETQTIVQEEGQRRGIDAVRRAGEALAAGRSFSFIEEGVFSGMSAGMWNVHWTFPMILRRSLFLSICSHTEHVLRQWCRHLQGHWGLAKELGKKRSDKTDLAHCMEYLRDDVKLAVGGFEQWPEWTAVDTNRLIRNCLTHDGGIVPEEHKERLSKVSYIEVDESGLISDEPMVNVLPGACETAAAAAKDLFEKLTRLGGADPRAASKP